MNSTRAGRDGRPERDLTPAFINGITIHPKNPWNLIFIVGTGDQKLQGKAFEEESTQLIKYLLASLTVPEDRYGSTSPYEKDRIVPTGARPDGDGTRPPGAGLYPKTVDGLSHVPEKGTRQRVLEENLPEGLRAVRHDGDPDQYLQQGLDRSRDGVVYEHGNSAFVVKSRLKVMLRDYNAFQAISQKPFFFPEGNTGEKNHGSQSSPGHKDSTRMLG